MFQGIREGLTGKIDKINALYRKRAGIKTI